ncbi:MAG: MBL fold metallo-hydrolase [Chloroflexi bacterium]|nr:MBL fold metallo-hydrolase [Chloroflexota bacterium]
MNYTIKALLTGIQTYNGHFFKLHNVPDMKLKIRAPIQVFLLQGENGKNILVEAGCPGAIEGPMVWGAADQPVPDGGGADGVRNALATVGLEIDDIDMLILTHLHLDAAWCIDIFNRAQIIVQRNEFAYALKPFGWQMALYSRRVILDLAARKKPQNLRPLNGDTELGDGLSVLLTPGHTPATQTVIVQTARGKVAITPSGPTYANWFPANPRFGFPLGFLADTYNPCQNYTQPPLQYIGEMRRIARAADIILPVYEPGIPKVIPDQWWFLPPEKNDARVKEFQQTGAFSPGLYLAE